VFALEVVLVVAWAVTLLTTLLNVALIPRLRPVDRARPPQPHQDGITGELPLPEVSIVVPARNEERTIERTLRALLAQTFAPLEVILVNDRSTDATAAIAELVAATEPRLVIVHGEEPPDGWLGKPWALHQGSRRARGDLLLFVDADIHYAPQTVATLVERILTRDVAMVSLFPRFEMHGFWEHIGMTGLATVGFMVMPAWLGNRTSIVELGIGGGPGNLVRRDAFEEIGGYEALKDAIIDDVGMARQIRARGQRTEFVIGDTLASLRMYHGRREIIDGFTKNLFPVLGGSYVIAILMLLLVVLFDFVPYALALRGDVLAVVAVGLIAVSRVVLFARLRYRLDNALFGFPLSQLFWAWILFRSMWVTGIRRQMHWRGRAYGRNWTRFGRRR
jgi:glycosyltransferase involved in cell wall biosynthesis